MAANRCLLGGESNTEFLQYKASIHTRHQWYQIGVFSAPLFGHGHITAEPVENMRNLYHTYWNSLALQIIGIM